MVNILEQIFKIEPVRTRAVLCPDPVFIIGMHRSGTSALGAALEPLGLTVGKSVMPYNSQTENPKGFFENIAIVELHDQFLAAIKSIWCDYHRVSDNLFSGIAARRFREKLPHLLRVEYGQRRALIKDPRMCRLMPLWIPLIEEYFPQARFVLPIRHPVEVAHSIRKRTGFDLAIGMKIWAVHVLEAERHTRGYPRQFTTYDQLLQSPGATVARLSEALELSATLNAEQLTAQVDPTLRHYANPPWPEGEANRDLLLAIHQTLAASDPDMEKSLDSLGSEYYRGLR